MEQKGNLCYVTNDSRITIGAIHIVLVGNCCSSYHILVLYCVKLLQLLLCLYRIITQFIISNMFHFQLPKPKAPTKWEEFAKARG